MSRLSVCVFLLLLILIGCTKSDDPSSDHNVQHQIFGDLVPNETTARAIAEGIIRGKYGEDALKVIQPMSVREDGEFWIVIGKSSPNPLPPMMQIHRTDAQITHFLYTVYVGPDCECDKGRRPSVSQE